MNNLYSGPERYYKRWLTPLLQTAVQEHPIVVLTGARQVGKSTLLRQAEPFHSWRYHTLDDFDVLLQAREEPSNLWAGSSEIVLDEVQRVPALLHAVKRAVDEQPGRLRFLLSGSANLLLMQQVSESLAGRAVYLVLDPITLGETVDAPAPNVLSQLLAGQLPAEQTLSATTPDVAPLLLRGFMPSLLTHSTPQTWLRWWDGYVTTYLERDLRQISQVSALPEFRRMMEMLALRTGQLLNQSELARDTRISQPTIHRYLGLLESTYLFERLPVYATNRTTRLVKSPRSFWMDAGLAVFLAGYYDEASLRASREFGSFFETMLFHHLRTLSSLLIPRARLYTWRTQAGAEVDFVIEHGRHILAIEVKMTTDPGYRHTDGLRKFLEEHPQAVGGVLVHGGNQVKRLSETIIALPWTVLTGQTQINESR